MINLLEVSNKLNEILNSVDNPLRIDNERVSFLVATEGYRLDKIANRQLGKNLIPVFIGLGGGENNPIPHLKQQSKSINIAIYYPIRYKDIFYDLEAYLGDLFIGKMLNFGELSGKCLTNMGVAQFGEIVGMDFEQFKEWTGSVYRQTIEESSNWFSMQLTLYVTQIAEGFLFGNDTKFTMDLKYREFYVNDIVVNGVNYQRLPSGDDEDLYCWKNANNEFIYTKENNSLLAENLDFLNGKIRKAYDNELENEYDIEEVTITENETFNNVEEEIVWTNAGTGASISPISQQLIGVDKFAKISQILLLLTNLL